MFVVAFGMLVCRMVYSGELLYMLSWSVWWSIMRSYCIC